MQREQPIPYSRAAQPQRLWPGQRDRRRKERQPIPRPEEQSHRDAREHDRKEAVRMQHRQQSGYNAREEQISAAGRWGAGETKRTRDDPIISLSLRLSVSRSLGLFNRLPP